MFFWNYKVIKTQYWDETTRTCSHCGKKQRLDEHCLGLNPPEYIKTWYTIE